MKHLLALLVVAALTSSGCQRTLLIVNIFPAMGEVFDVPAKLFVFIEHEGLEQWRLIEDVEGLPTEVGIEFWSVEQEETDLRVCVTAADVAQVALACGCEDATLYWNSTEWVELDVADPGQTNLLRPRNGDYTGSSFPNEPGAPVFDWALPPIECNFTYEIRIARGDIDLENPEIEETVPAPPFVPDPPLDIVPNGDPVGAKYYWLVRTCTGPTCFAPPRSFYLYVGRNNGTNHDVDGDGTDDFVVGAPAFPGGAMAGIAYLHSGASLAGSPVEIGSAPDDRFGDSVAIVGDVDADAFADVLVGAPGAAAQQGRAFLFRGSSGAPNLPEMLIGDGTAEGFGFAVASAGDVDGDGYADVIVGAPANSATMMPNEGAAYLFFGSGTKTLVPAAANPIRNPATIDAEDRFGFSVASAGDFDGDGYGDVVIGAPGVPVVGAWVFFGPDLVDNVNLARFEVMGFSEHGWAVAGIGDFDADGFDDVVVGAPGGANGSAFVFYGSNSRVGPRNGNRLDSKGGALGRAVARAGDVNGDGFVDFLVGAPSGAAPVFGRVELYFGGPTVVTNLVQGLGFVSPEMAPEEFGHSLGGGGDLTGDGIDDFIVGAPFNSIPMLANRGAVYIFVGQGPTSPGGTILGAEGDELGESVD